MEPKLIKIDRNGSKHYEGLVECPKCGGSGLIIWCVRNGQPIPTIVDNGVCWKCGGTGKVKGKWIERTPEYQAKLDARREAKEAIWRAEQERIAAEREAERLAKEEQERIEREAEEARIRAEKAKSQYVGEIGERMTIKATYIHGIWFTVRSFYGFGDDTMYIHKFKDENDNVFVWKTGRGLGTILDGSAVTLVGTVKEHSEYKDEKQTVLTRCKVTEVQE